MKKIENSECLNGFGKFIRQGREKRDMLKTEVAIEVGISQAYYSYLERGEREIDFGLALKICQVLHLDLSDFISAYME